MPSSASTAAVSRPGDVLSIALDLLDDNPFQPRTSMDPTSLRELMASLAQTGLIQPIAVRAIGGGRYQIVAGHRRAAAFRLLLAGATTDAERSQYAKIRAHVVGDISDAQMAVAAYVENVQRAELSLVDEAGALARIREVGGHATAAQVAEATAQPERRVRRLLKLFTAPAVVKEFVTEGLKVNTAAPGEPVKNELRRLDLMAALEFVRLYEQHAKLKPATANDRTTTAISVHSPTTGAFAKFRPGSMASSMEPPRLNPSPAPNRRWPRGACPQRTRAPTSAAPMSHPPLWLDSAELLRPSRSARPARSASSST